MFRARWTPHIQAEVRRTLLGHRFNLPEARLDSMLRLMHEKALQPMITGYEPCISGLKLPDADDRHVLAAAIAADADTIVTFNLKHFPAAALAEHGVEAVHPDEFLASQVTLQPGACSAVVRRLQGRMTRPEIEQDVEKPHRGCGRAESRLASSSQTPVVFSHAGLSLLARHDPAAPSPDAWFLNVLLDDRPPRPLPPQPARPRCRRAGEAADWMRGTGGPPAPETLNLRHISFTPKRAGAIASLIHGEHGGTEARRWALLIQCGGSARSASSAEKLVRAA